ncbi:AIR synthase-related protein, partial [Thalassobaculum salexigens]|uniref:AIR synthase-related protein n=1 Tax=Thalassobaculum salexigens TaxID=455360 RepID=UPI00248D8E59
MLTSLLGSKPDGSAGEPIVLPAGAVHISGGGLAGRLRDYLPPGVGATLYRLPDLPEVLLEAQELSHSLGPKESNKLYLSDRDAYLTFHGGVGMALFCEEDEALKVIAHARHYGIVHDPHGRYALPPLRLPASARADARAKYEAADQQFQAQLRALEYQRDLTELRAFAGCAF